MANEYDALTQQILGQGLMSQWSGEGFGSAEANAADMARILSSIGITDINQFGEVAKYDPVSVVGYTLNGTQVQNPRPGEYYTIDRQYGDDNGYYDVRRNLSAEEAAQVKPIYGTNVGTNEEGYPTYTSIDPSNVISQDGGFVTKTGTTYGNKATGQVVPLTYSERQTGNAWGGTFAGEGNTGYRVQFDAQGNPYFYTTGASSNDLANLLGDNKLLNLAANVAAAYFGGPLGSAALQVAKGGDAGDALKAAALTYGAQQIPGLFGDGGVQQAMDADIAGGMVPEFGTNAAYDSAMASAMTPEAMAAIEAGIAGPMGPLTQAELGQGFQDYMQAAGYTADMMGPMTAEQLGNSFQDYMAKEGYTSSPVSGIPKGLQEALLKQLPGLFAGGLAASAAGQNTSTYTPPPAYKPQDTMPSYSPEYFNQVQDYYTGYMPNMPRDVATPLQDWYNTGYTGEDSVTKKLFGV